MASECLPCPSGHFCGASGLAAPSGPCSPGYFCLEGVSSPTPAGKGSLRTGVGPALARCPEVGGHSGYGRGLHAGQFEDKGEGCERAGLEVILGWSV